MPNMKVKKRWVVRFYRTEQDGSQILRCSVQMDDKGKVSFHDTIPGSILADELKGGVPDPETGDRIRPKDGLKFLKVLQKVYSSSILRASAPEQGTIEEVS